VWVRYRLALENHRTVTGALTALRRRRRERVSVEALRGLNLDLPAGSLTGIVGANGAGKSTLLRVIAGIVPPSEGYVEVRGKVAAVLALGAGFNPALSGRHNVDVGGMAAGMSRAEVRERFAEIEAFAGIGRYIDAPMRTYSAGMFARLTFAVAVAAEPDILLVDEVLGTGDAAFQERCDRKVHELRDKGCAIVLASHSAAQVEAMTTTAVWLHRGELRAHGPTEEVTAAYEAFRQAHPELEAGGSIAS
jgi:ABC-type polysaccharide/polyol phosphate transport system ATPase subunit